MTTVGGTLDDVLQTHCGFCNWLSHKIQMHGSCNKLTAQWPASTGCSASCRGLLVADTSAFHRHDRQHHLHTHHLGNLLTRLYSGPRSDPVVGTLQQQWQLTLVGPCASLSCWCVTNTQTLQASKSLQHSKLHNMHVQGTLRHNSVVGVSAVNKVHSVATAGPVNRQGSRELHVATLAGYKGMLASRRCQPPCKQPPQPHTVQNKHPLPNAPNCCC